MAGGVDQGNERDEAVLGIADEFAQLGIGIERSVRLVARRTARLDPPGLIIGEVDGESVELVECEEIDNPLHLLYGEERADNVEMKAAPSEPRRIQNVLGVQHHGAICARRGRRQKLDEGRQPARDPDSLDTAHNDAISADLQQITLVLGDLSVRGDADRRRQRVEVGGAAKLDADGSNVVDRRALCDLNRFELEPGAAGNVLAETTNNRLQCSVCVLDTDAIPDSQLPGVGGNV